MARRKTGDKKVAGKSPTIGGEATIHHVQADDHSIAFEGIQVSGNVGDIRIGHTIGYTAEQVSVLLKQITTTLQPKPFDGRCPYKGLEVFEEEDAELFFGRERLVNELVGRVKESRTVFITGPSGSGKSSLVRAGLIHALKQGAIKGSERWLYETMKPGREPLKDLSLAFSRLKSPELEDYFLAHSSETDILNKCAESVLSGRKDQHFLLFIDQFEEVFTQINSEEERVAFINMLSHAGTVENGRVTVLFAMRSDFVSNCATYPPLNELLGQQFRQIGAMQPEELVSAIALPAMYVGLPVENELIAQIINDMKGEPGSLPLMQFALKDLFDSQQEKGGVIALTLKDYLRHGGIHKCLERHADATFAKLSEREQELTRSIFSALIEIGRGTQDTKRTALFDELIPANTKAEDVLVIVQKLADARLIITDEQAGKDTVTISHEKLIEAWPWLKKLVNENRDAIAMQNEIASDAKEWEDHNRDESYLYSGARMANVREQLQAQKLVLSGLAHEFVQAGRARQRRNQMTLIAGVAAIIVLLIVAVIIVSNQASIAEANRSLAEVNRIEAEAQKATAQAASTIAAAQADEARKQTDIALARQLAAQAQSIFTLDIENQVIAGLLAVQSMKMFPSVEAGQVLQKLTLPHSVNYLSLSGRVRTVTFSPDGKYVAAAICSGFGLGCDTSTLRVWEATTGKEIYSIVRDLDVISIVFSQDGNHIASGSYDGIIRVREVVSGKEIAQMSHAHNSQWNSVISIAFSPDGKYLVAGSADGSACVWEPITGQEINCIIHDKEVLSVAFSPDNKLVVSASADGTARAWDAITGKEIARMTHDGAVRSVAFSPDAQYIVSGSSDARVWGAFNGMEISRIRLDGSISSVTFSPNGKYAALGGCAQQDSANEECIQGIAQIWDVATGKEIIHVTNSKRIDSVSFNKDGKFILSVARNTVWVWDGETGKEVARMTHDGVVTSAAFSPDGRYVVSGDCYNGGNRGSHNWCYTGTVRVWESVATMDRIMALSSKGGILRMWDAISGKEIANMKNDDHDTSVDFSPDGKYEVHADLLNDTVRLLDTNTGEEIARMIHENVDVVAFSPDGEFVVSGGSDDVRVWEADTGKEVARRIDHARVTSIAFSPDGKYLLSGGLDGIARVWEISTGKEIAQITHGSDVTHVAFSPDGSHVLSGSRDNARVWNLSTGKEVVRILVRIDYGSRIIFSHDGKYLLYIGCDLRDSFYACLQGSFRVWNSTTGQEVATKSHNDEVSSIALSPDNKYIASGWCDQRDFYLSCTHGTARIWDVATGREIARVDHDNPVIFVAFSPDGNYLVSEDKDGTIQVSRYHPEEMIFDACSRVTRNLTRTEWDQYVGNVLPYQSVCPNLPIEPEPTPTAAP